jgi:hypothetical protein
MLPQHAETTCANSPEFKFFYDNPPEEDSNCPDPLQETDQEGVKRDMELAEFDSLAKARMPQKGMDDSVVALFKFCLASFIYHKNSGWLDSNTHSQSSLRCSPFWSEDVLHANRVRTAYPWTSTRDTPEITGLPLDTLYLAEIEFLRAGIENIRKSIVKETSRLENAVV